MKKQRYEYYRNDVKGILLPITSLQNCQDINKNRDNYKSVLGLVSSILLYFFQVLEIKYSVYKSTSVKDTLENYI